MAVQFFTREDLERKLRPYRCRCLETLRDGTEIWITGWGYVFTMAPEYVADDEARYDSWQWEQVLAHVVARTMPSSFDSAVEEVERPRPKLVSKKP